MTGALAALAAPIVVATSGGGGTTPPSGAIAISNQSIFRNSSSGSTVSAVYIVQNDGTIRNHNGTLLETWNSSAGSVGSYDVMFTNRAGDGPLVGTFDSWMSCGTSREVSLTASAGQFYEASFTVKIRDSASGVEQDSATITLNASSEF